MLCEQPLVAWMDLSPHFSLTPFSQPCLQLLTWQRIKAWRQRLVQRQSGGEKLSLLVHLCDCMNSEWWSVMVAFSLLHLSQFSWFLIWMIKLHSPLTSPIFIALIAMASQTYLHRYTHTQTHTTNTISPCVTIDHLRTQRSVSGAAKSPTSCPSSLS